MVRTRNKWDEHGIQRLLDELILDVDTNQVLNYPELGELFGVGPAAIKRIVIILRRKGRVPEYDPSRKFEAHLRPYTESELNRMTTCFNAGMSVEEVALRFERTHNAIRNVRMKLEHQGKVSPLLTKWTQEQIGALLSELRTDKNGIVLNYHRLSSATGHSLSAVRTKVNDLRRCGVIEKPTRLGASDPVLEKRKEYHNRLMHYMLFK